MKLRRLIAVARKEFLHVLRDPRSLGMGIGIPVVLLLLFGYALTLDVDNVRLAVWDQDGSVESRELVSRFDASRYFTVAARPDDYRVIDRMIDQRDIMAALVIPYDFSHDLARGRTASVQFVVDGSDANTASIAVGYADAITGAYSRQAAVKLVPAAARLTDPIDLRPRVWFNEDLESRNYIVPGLIAVIMMIIAALLTSLTVAREWETGTMEQLISTPVRGVELIVGKMIPYFAIGMFDVLVATLMGTLLFHVPLRGSVLFLFASAAIFLVGALAQGVLISIVTKGQLVASQLAMITTFLPAFLLSGFVYDIANMPRVLQLLSHVIAARYFIALLKGIFLKGLGVQLLVVEVAFLAGFGAILFALANAKFRKRLD